MSRFTVTLRPGFLARSVALVVVRVAPGARRWTIRALDSVAAFLTDNGAPATVWAVAESRPYVRPAIGRAVETGVAQCFAA